MLKIQNLQVKIEDKLILKDINLQIKPGSFHVLMGPNGSGKSSLAYTLMGHPNYKVTAGTVLLENQNLLELPVEQRSRLGIFLAYQYPIAIPGVQVFTFLKEAHRMLTGQELSVKDFQNLVYSVFDQVNLNHSFLHRYLNEGFSGGEKKRLEIAQLLLFKPKIAILDEIDSGLDIDGLKIIAQTINLARQDNKEMSIILITHYARILDSIAADHVHILQDGKILKSGDKNLAHIIENNGYNGLQL